MYDQIARNKRASAWLCLMLVIFFVVVGTLFAVALGGAPEIGAAVAAAFAALLVIGGYYGGSATLLMVSHAREIEHADHPQLFNVVEEMAIAAGVPRPRIFVIDDSAPNAFATGCDPQHSAVAVTTGLLEKLDRDELQGVIAHEIAHIKNYDIRFGTLMAVLVGGIALMCDWFREIAFRIPVRASGRRSSRSSGGLEIIVLLLAILLSIVAPLIARLIQFAASRQREFLADATAALLTRYPQGLASALRKIHDDPEVLEVANRATQHLYIVNPIRSHEARAASMFDTHPPITERIERLLAMAGEIAHPRGTAPVGSAPRSGAVEAAPGLPLAGVAAAAATSEVSPAPEGDAVAPRPPCPRCQEPLGRGRYQGDLLFGCRQCGGIWLGEKTLHALLASAPQRLAALDRRYPNRIGHGWDRVANRRCPVCRVKLVPYRDDSLAPAWLDRCGQCGGLWFDDGELAMLAHTAGRSQQMVGTPR